MGRMKDFKDKVKIMDINSLWNNAYLKGLKIHLLNDTELMALNKMTSDEMVERGLI